MHVNLLFFFWGSLLHRYLEMVDEEWLRYDLLGSSFFCSILSFSGLPAPLHLFYFDLLWRAPFVCFFFLQHSGYQRAEGEKGKKNSELKISFGLRADFFVDDGYDLYWYYVKGRGLRWWVQYYFWCVDDKLLDKFYDHLL